MQQVDVNRAREDRFPTIPAIPRLDHWFEHEIQVALAMAKVAVLLVTADFLASDFIDQHELAPLLKTAEKGGVRILWIPVKACSYKETALKDFQSMISPEKPLAEMKAERNRAWVKICEGIKEAMNFSGAP